MTSSDAQFVDFVEGSSSELLRFAWGVSGRRETAEDLVQDALQQVYLRWKKIHGSPLGYTKRAIVNGHLDLLRRHRIVRFLPFHRTASDAAGFPDCPDLRLTIQSELERLPPRERTVVALRYVCDLPEREVAELLEISVGTVKASASRGVAKLRDALTDCERV